MVPVVRATLQACMSEIEKLVGSLDACITTYNVHYLKKALSGESIEVLDLLNGCALKGLLKRLPTFCFTLSMSAFAKAEA